MTNQEFNAKWDESRYHENMSLAETREYLEDLFDMYETDGFCETFESPYDGMKTHNGKTFDVVRRCTEKDWDIECLPAWVIVLQGGVQIDALPEEICKTERKAH